MDGHSKFHRSSAGTPTPLEMPQKFTQAHDFQHKRSEVNFIINYVINWINRIILKKLTAIQLVKKFPVIYPTHLSLRFLFSYTESK